EEENQHIMEYLKDTYLEILKERQDKVLLVPKERRTKKKNSREQIKKGTDSDDEEAMEEYVLFDESNEIILIDSIDESRLKEGAVLPIPEAILIYHVPIVLRTQFRTWTFGRPVSAKNHRDKSVYNTGLGYWDFDLTQQILYECTKFSKNEMNKIVQDSANHVHWSPQPTPEYLQQYSDSNYFPFLSLYNISKQGAKTEEEHKFIIIYPLFNIIRLLKILGHPINLKPFGEVAHGLEWTLAGFEMQWTGLYRFGLIKHYHIPSNKENCASFEDAFCLLKELEKIN
ncbi:3960_t:CDS:2, partial [Funneliformis geosporum]